MKINLTIFILFFISFFKSQIISDTINVNTNIHSVIVVNGKILKLDLGKNLTLIDEPLNNNENTYITIKALNNFEGYDYINIINSTDEFYKVSVKYTKKINTPFFFLGKQKSLKKSNYTINTNDIDDKIKSTAEKINLKKTEDIIRSYIRQNDVIIKVTDVFSYKDYIFLRLLINNQSAYSFLLDGVNFKISEKNTWKKTSSSEEVITSLFRTKDFVEIEPNNKLYLTFVFNAFKITKNKYLKIILQEKYLNSSYSIDLDNKFINEPTTYNDNINKKRNQTVK